MKKIFFLSTLCVLFSFLLIFPSQSLEASKTGLLLWFDTLLPTLLPFLILSQMILKTDLIFCVQKIFAPVFQKLFHCSAGGAFCILCGFLCGYPVGARLIALQLQEGRLSLTESQYLLSFCNNVSPMFCISYGIFYAIGAKQVLPYLLIIYGSALLFGLLNHPKKISDGDFVPAVKKQQTSSPENLFQLIDVCIIDSFSIMIKLCGYLILFSVLNTALLMLLPQNTGSITACLVSAVLEITSGLSKVRTLPTGILRSAICIFSLSFGGLCCIFQTNSIIHDTKLSLKTYILHKLLTAVLALFLFGLWLFCCFAVNGGC